MRTEQYEVRNFLQHDSLSGDMVVHTTAGIVLVREHRMKAFLCHLEDSMRTRVLGSEMSDWFGPEAEEARNFLLRYSVLAESPMLNFAIEEVELVTNCAEVGELVNSTMADSRWTYSLCHAKADIVKQIERVAGRPVLLSVFLNPYVRDIAMAVRDTFLHAKDTVLLMSYTYNNCLYIDSPYQENWKLPCHVCQMSQIQSDLRLRFTGGVTYQQIVDQLYDHDTDVPIYTPLTPRWSLNIATQLSNRIYRLANLDDTDRMEPEELRYAFMLDLNSLVGRADTTTHWELCDCYE